MNAFRVIPLSVLGLTFALEIGACHARGATTTQARPTYDHSCQVDHDCGSARSCCPSPCPTDPINVRDVERANQDLHCDPDEQCPVAGGCVENQILCVAGSCKVVFAGDPAFRQRKE